MKTLFHHRRIRSEEVLSNVPEPTSISLPVTPEVACLETFATFTSPSSGPSTLVPSSAPNCNLHNSKSFQQLPLPKSSSSQSLKRLNPIAYLRRRSVDATGARPVALRTSPVLTLDECHDFGIIYGTRPHNWGENENEVKVETEPHEGDLFVDLKESFVTVNVDEEATLEPEPSDMVSSPTTKSSNSASGSSESSKTTTDFLTNDPDTQSIFSFDENTGLGRNRSVTLYRSASKSLDAAATAETRVYAATIPQGYEFYKDFSACDDDTGDADSEYDACLDEVNAVPENYVGDQLSFRSNSGSSRSSGSLAHRKSRSVKKKDQIVTIFAQEVVSDDEEESLLVNESPMLSLIESTGIGILSPITEG